MSNISVILEGLNINRINDRYDSNGESFISEGVYDFDDYTINYGIQFPIDGIAKAFDRFKNDGYAKFGKWEIKTDKYNSHLDWILSYKDTDLVNCQNGKINNIGLKVKDLEKLYNKVLKNKFQGSKVTNWELSLLDMPIPDNDDKKRIAREKRDEDDYYDRVHKEGRYANESSINEISKGELISLNKKKYDYVQKNASKLIKDKIDLAITNSLILRYIKGRNWEGGLGNGKDIDKMLDKLSSEYGLDDMFIADKLDELIEFWEKQLSKAGLE